MNSINLSQYIQSWLIARNIEAQEQFECIVWDDTLPEFYTFNTDLKLPCSGVESVDTERFVHRIKQHCMQYEKVCIVLTHTPLESIVPALKYAQKHEKCVLVLHTFGGMGGRIVWGVQDATLCQTAIRNEYTLRMPYDTLSLFSMSRLAWSNTGVTVCVVQPGEYPSALPLWMQDDDQYSLHTFWTEPTALLYVSWRMSTQCVEVAQILNQDHWGTVGVVVWKSPFPVIDETTRELYESIWTVHCFGDRIWTDYASALQEYTASLTAWSLPKATFIAYTPPVDTITVHHPDYLYESMQRGKESLVLWVAHLVGVTLSPVE